MKPLSTLIIQYQQKIFYGFLILLLIGGAVLPSLANTPNDSYQKYIDKAITALDNADTRAAYAAFAKARNLARKNKDEAQKEAFLACLDKIPIYEVYFPLIESADTFYVRKNYRDAQSALLAAREQLDLSIEIGADVPAFVQYEADKRQALQNRIEEIDAIRKPLIEAAIAKGEDLFLQNLPGEALEQFTMARDQMLVQSNESRLYRIGERILKAELHYDIYTQLNLGRREAGYKRYRDAQEIYQDALAKIERSREHYFPRLEALDLKRYQEIEELIENVNDKRVKRYESAISQGQDYLERDDPETAVKAFSYAKEQMFEDRKEYQTSGVDQLLNQAHYSLAVREGDQQLQRADYLGALAAYQEAQQQLQTPEILQKIERVTEEGYRQALAQGLQAFSQSDYESARNHYQTAATFKNSPELNGYLHQHYQQLLDRGRQENTRADYAQAMTYFENARLFADTPEVQELLGRVEESADYASAYAAGEQFLREGQITAAKESFEQARRYQNSIEVQNQLFAIEDYLLALNDGRRALKNNDTELAKAYFQNAQDIYNTAEVNDLLRQTGAQTDRDRLAVRSYDAPQPAIFASRAAVLPKGIGMGSIDFEFNTVMWMRPDCSLNWTVELYNAYGTLVGTQRVDSQCRFTFADLPDGTYTYRLKLQESSGQTTTYRTESNEVTIQNGQAVSVEIDAVGKG